MIGKESHMTTRTVLITGCSSGIGLHCAKALKERGWQVFATARQDDDLARLTALDLTPLRLDYTAEDSITTALSTMLAQTNGRIDALFNNGAYGQPGAVEDLPTEALRAQFEANLFGWHELTRQVIPHMRKQGHGRLVHCSSVLGLVPLKYRGAYTASKFALEGLMTTQRLELRGTGLHVSMIEPGPIDSRFSENALKAFENNITLEGSAHESAYRAQLATLARGGTSSRFKLGPEAVANKLIHALEADRPKPHYYVTLPTYLMAAFRRILPARMLDSVLTTISDKA